MERSERPGGQQHERRYFTDAEAVTALAMIYSVLLKEIVLPETQAEEVTEAAQAPEYTQLPLAGIVFDKETHTKSDPAI